MENEIWFLKIDYNIQKALLILSVIAIPTFYLFFIPFLLLGFWQVASGLHGVIALKSKHHIYYITIVFPYLSLMYFFFGETITYAFPLLILFYILIPSILAGLYFNLTKKTWNQLKENSTQLNEFEMEEVLDNGEK